MDNAVIVDAVRTGTGKGKPGGGLSGVHAVELLRQTLQSLVGRTGVDPGLVEDVIPLLDRGYGIGQMMPAGYSYYNVPYQYRDYYQDTNDYYYRYAPGAIYQVDRDSQLITAIAALLTGGLSVGQQLPASYSMYNVPFAYRDRYYDSPDAWYRYSNGYIYEVDPTTQLIRTMVQALV